MTVINCPLKDCVHQDESKGCEKEEVELFDRTYAEVGGVISRALNCDDYEVE